LQLHLGEAFNKSSLGNWWHLRHDLSVLIGLNKAFDSLIFVSKPKELDNWWLKEDQLSVLSWKLKDFIKNWCQRGLIYLILLFHIRNSSVKHESKKIGFEFVVEFWIDKVGKLIFLWLSKELFDVTSNTCWYSVVMGSFMIHFIVRLNHLSEWPKQTLNHLISGWLFDSFLTDDVWFGICWFRGFGRKRLVINLCSGSWHT